MRSRSLLVLLLSLIWLTPSQVSANTRLGLHVTSDELAIWRTRMLNGPYKSTGDVSSNSPDDWDRMTANAEAFRLAPTAGMWTGPTGTGCMSASQLSTVVQVRTPTR